MKQFITLAIIIIASLSRLAVPCHAEKTEAKKFPADRVAKETALYVETLKLKGDDAKKFTKLYTEYRRKIHNALEKNSIPFKCENTKLTDEQIDKNIRARFASSREMLEIREQYYPKFLKIITPAQYEKLNKLEQRVFEKSRHEHQRRKSTRTTTTNKRSTQSRNSSSVAILLPDLSYLSEMQANLVELKKICHAQKAQVDGDLVVLNKNIAKLKKIKHDQMIQIDME
ncbi:MAG: hypothetical protein K2H44_06610 [Muribaculaceae bacterium]|nr:hypothetical protein [Muribaculaceae bacterium]